MMANQSSNNNNSNSSSSIIPTTTTISPWKKLSSDTQNEAPFSMDDVSSWPALSSQRVAGPQVIIITESSPPSSGGSVDGSEIGVGNNNDNESSSEVSDSVVAVSVDSSTLPRRTHSHHPRPPVHRQYNQHYPSSRFGSNQRGNDGFNAKNGNNRGEGGGYGFQNQNFQNRRYHQHQHRGGFNHNRGGFSNLRSQQQHNFHNYHGFGNGSSGFLGPPPLPHPPMVNPPPYVNINFNVNHPSPPPPPPPPVPAPGYMLPFGYYSYPYFSEASNPLYYPPPVSSISPPLQLQPPPPPPPYLDVMSGAPIYNQPILPNPEVELCGKILHQIEYYFSKENLVKDAYLKSLMNHEGWVSVLIIAGFRKVKALTSDTSLVVRALLPSASVEVQGDRVRKRGDWMNWVHHFSPAARISPVTDISTRIQNIQLGESAGADAS